MNLACLFITVATLAIAIFSKAQNPVVNPDGVKYLMTAQAFMRGDFDLAMAAYKWPAYPFSVAIFSKLTFLDAETGAWLLNMLLRIAIGLGFLRIVQLLGGSNRVLLYAAAVFVIYPGLNELQALVVRDFAYWALWTWMAVNFLVFFKTGRQKSLICFVLLGALAIAYRIEGIVYLVLLGLWLFWKNGGKSQSSLSVLLPGAFALVFLLGIAYMWGYQGDLERTEHLLNMLGDRRLAFKAQYLGILDSGQWGWVSQILSWALLLLLPVLKLVLSVLDVYTLGFLVILGLAWLIGKDSLTDAVFGTSGLLRPWLCLVSVNIALLLGYALIWDIHTDRYAISLCLLLLVYVPFAIEKILGYNYQTVKWKVFSQSALALIVTITAVEGLDRTSSKTHLKEAGLWLSENTKSYNDKKIYSNSRIVDYYAGRQSVPPDTHYGRPVLTELAETTRWNKLHFMAVDLGKSRYGPAPGFIRQFDYIHGKKPDKIFWNRKGEAIAIYDFRNRLGDKSRKRQSKQ